MRLVKQGIEPEVDTHLLNIEPQQKPQLTTRERHPEHISNLDRFRLDIHTDTVCYVACQGDCEMTEWSRWSHCHRDCLEHPSGKPRTHKKLETTKP
jgi:hypothetical protein